MDIRTEQLISIDLSPLTEKQRAYIKDRLSGLTYSQIGRKYCVTRQCVEQAIYEATLGKRACRRRQLDSKAVRILEERLGRYNVKKKRLLGELSVLEEKIDVAKQAMAALPSGKETSS